MNFTAHRLPYEQTGYFSRLVNGYLNGDDFLKSFYAHPVSLAGIAAAIRAREQFPTVRDTLVQVLQDQYKDQPANELVNDSIRQLLNQNTFTVTTAHQPAIFTGSLYFIYKILHVIKTAADLSVKFPGKNFLPIYYMGSEDADLEELGHIYLDQEKISWNTSQTGAVGRMSTSGLEEILQRIEGEFADQPHGPELFQLLKTCYLESDTVQSATFKLLHHLFGDYGLIVLIADDPRLKTLMKPVFRDDLFSHKPFQITRQTVHRLSEQYPAQANPREINLFYMKDNTRERIDLKEGQYKVHNSGISFSRETLEAELEAYPERFSPNVILRGLFQETILPDIAFVGGGGETAYWLELKSLFDHYRVPYPVLILRNSFLLIRKPWRIKMEKAGLSPETVFQKGELLLEQTVKSHSSNQLNLEKEIRQLEAYYHSLKQITEAVDETLSQHVESLRSKALKGVCELEKKILRAEKRNFADAGARIQEVRAALFPLEGLQERIENFIPWYAIYGKSFFDLIYKNSLTLEGEFVVLEEQ
ncbi:MAG: bacillithiol biosynthesis cysteine-adding enzyme BshC [Bacteroidota bacterium]|nr:bacillithiol biosynthesis cysteine-adding enzyme BshC [Bacteroidota bacterium]MDP4211540.1 bacillithiol biosynthesis cysteine-adding enzyme BshC [Bacteroidota bacterium]MDP4249755.1 bacillithiol biosynthesis cysteine-adding enzyme BshC [Bacteroidota bacterium]